MDGYAGRDLEWANDKPKIYTGVDKPASKEIMLDLQAVSPSDYADEVV